MPDGAAVPDDGFAGLSLSDVPVGEVTLRVRHGGSGPPLLLLHGYPETHLMWGGVAGELAGEFTVVAPDLRGYGRKPRMAPPNSASKKKNSGSGAISRSGTGSGSARKAQCQ